MKKLFIIIAICSSLFSCDYASGDFRSERSKQLDSVTEIQTETGRLLDGAQDFGNQARDKASKVQDEIILYYQTDGREKDLHRSTAKRYVEEAKALLNKSDSVLNLADISRKKSNRILSHMNKD